MSDKTRMRRLRRASRFPVLRVGLLGLIPWAAAILWTSLRLVSLGIRGWAGRRDGSLDRSMRAEMLGVLALILVRSTTSSQPGTRSAISRSGSPSRARDAKSRS